MARSETTRSGGEPRSAGGRSVGDRTRRSVLAVLALCVGCFGTRTAGGAEGAASQGAETDGSSGWEGHGQRAVAGSEQESAQGSAERSEQGPPVVALVRSRGDHVIAMRLAAELDALGYRVVEVTGPDAVRPLTELVARGDVDALLRATPSRTGIELVIAVPPPTGRAAGSSQTVEDLVSVGRRRHDDLLALRAVEALRARLLELGVVAPETFDAPDVTPLEDPGWFPVASEPVLEDERYSVPLLWLELAPTFGGDFELGMAPRAQLALRLEPADAWSVGVIGNFALRPQDVIVASAAAEATAEWFGAALDVRLVDTSWVVDLGAGAAVVRLRADGRAESPYEGRSPTALTTLPFLRLGVHPELSSVLRLRVESLVGFAAPRAIVGLADEEVRWGAPYWQTSLVFAVAVPGIER